MFSDFNRKLMRRLTENNVLKMKLRWLICMHLHFYPIKQKQLKNSDIHQQPQWTSHEATPLVLGTSLVLVLLLTAVATARTTSSSCCFCCRQGQLLEPNIRSESQIITGHSLVLPNVSMNQSGEYSCQASSPEGRTRSQHVRLHVLCE